MVAYCAVEDLLLGAIPLPSYLDSGKVIQDAADEIDSKLGYIYETPFDVSDPGPLERPARLLLKRINAHIATGRLILAVASPEENRNLHAYGYALLSEATAALNAIAGGEITLEGATAAENAATPAATVPLINNLDGESNVEAFYDRIANPAFLYPPTRDYLAPNPDGLVN